MAILLADDLVDFVWVGPCTPDSLERIWRWPALGNIFFYPQHHPFPQCGNSPEVFRGTSYQLGSLDPRFSKDSDHDGPCRFGDSDISKGVFHKIDEWTEGCRANSFYQLYHALGDQHVGIFWLWPQSKCGMGVLSAVLSGDRHLDSPVDHQSYMVEIFPVRPTGVVVEMFDLWEEAAF